MIVRNLTPISQGFGRGIKIPPFGLKDIPDHIARKLKNDPRFEVQNIQTENERMHGLARMRQPYRDTEHVEDLSDVDIFLLAHNQHERTERCLQHLTDATEQGFHTYLIDNDSEPEMKSLLDAYTRGPKTLLRTPDNLAFAKANNLAASVANGRFILLLNNDCYVDPTCLGMMRGAFNVDKSIAIVGAKLRYPQSGKIQHCGVIFQAGAYPIHYARNMPEESPETNIRGEWPAVTGACLMIRRDVWDMVNGLGEEYAPGGFEDVDLCCKAREKGFNVWYEPQASAIHEETVTYFSTPELTSERHLADRILFDVFQRRWASRYENLNSMIPHARLVNPGLLHI